LARSDDPFTELNGNKIGRLMPEAQYSVIAPLSRMTAAVS